MKKVINVPEQVVEEMLQGAVAAHPQYLKRVEGFSVLVRSNAPVAGKVGLVSGGGSGHEPSHAGFVGKGMLDGAVAGAVFTSPTPDQVYEGVKAVDSGKGVLLVVKNYTGDCMNFEMAGELAAADGIKVESVIVNDDVAVENSTWTVGRRGIAGTVFVHKIAGAKAETGAELAEVKRVAEKVVANVRSMGMALSPCTVPAAGKPSFELAENEIEIGMPVSINTASKVKITNAFIIFPLFRHHRADYVSSHACAGCLPWHRDSHPRGFPPPSHRHDHGHGGAILLF